MAAPEYVPQPAIEHVRSYESPPRRPTQWHADRPGDEATVDGFERGARFGSPGPDQGYIYVLARRFQGQLQLADDEVAPSVDWAEARRRQDAIDRAARTDG